MKISLTPRELRALLTPDVQKTFDDIVSTMVEQGIDQDYAEAMLAKSFLSLSERRKVR